MTTTGTCVFFINKIEIFILISFGSSGIKQWDASAVFLDSDDDGFFVAGDDINAFNVAFTGNGLLVTEASKNEIVQIFHWSQI